MTDNDMAIKFVRAQSDSVAVLTEYKNTSMPNFLFYMVRQPDAPARGRTHLPAATVPGPHVRRRGRRMARWWARWRGPRSLRSTSI